MFITIAKTYQGIQNPLPEGVTVQVRPRAPYLNDKASTDVGGFVVSSTMLNKAYLLQGNKVSDLFLTINYILFTYISKFIVLVLSRGDVFGNIAL